MALGFMALDTPASTTRTHSRSRTPWSSCIDPPFCPLCVCVCVCVLLCAGPGAGGKEYQGRPGAGVPGASAHQRCGSGRIRQAPPGQHAGELHPQRRGGTAAGRQLAHTGPHDGWAGRGGAGRGGAGGRAGRAAWLEQAALCGAHGQARFLQARPRPLPYKVSSHSTKLAAATLPQWSASL